MRLRGWIAMGGLALAAAYWLTGRSKRDETTVTPVVDTTAAPVAP